MNKQIVEHMEEASMCFHAHINVGHAGSGGNIADFYSAGAQFEHCPVFRDIRLPLHTNIDMQPELGDDHFL
jgi:hypothetical protein